jgi:hypothetical protein
MLGAASPLQIALVLAAVSWPFAAGLGVVLWSKARAARRARREAAVEGELKGLFRVVEGKAVPERLALVVDALEEAEAMRTAVRGREKPAKTPVPSA